MQRHPKTAPKRHAQASPSEIVKLRAELAAERLAREAAERRCAELEEKVRLLTEKLDWFMKGQSQTEEFLQKKIRKLEKSVADRDAKIRKQAKSLAWFRKQKFGRTSEKSDSELDKPSVRSKSGAKGSKERGQQPGSEGHGPTDRGNVPVSERIPLEIAGGCKCEQCGVSFKELAKPEESRLFEYAESLYQNVYDRRKYVSQCQCKGKKIVTAPPPPKLYPRTRIGNSLWVRLVVQKFLQGVPTNRTLKDLSLMGFNLAQGTVTGGFRAINGLLDPLYVKIADHCRGGELWNADETTWRVFSGSKAKWWLWMVASRDAVAYVLDETRSGDVPKKFFAGCSGTLMTDRLAAYKGLGDEILNAWCWVHVRRDFHKIMIGVPELKNWAHGWLKKITTLFLLNHERFKLWQDRGKTAVGWDTAHEKLEKHLARMQQCWQRELKTIGQEEERRTVLNSLRRHWDGLTLFLEDPRIPLHNNRAERLLRNVVILRKGSYGSGAEWSGEFAAKLFSIIQTWLINGLDPQRMLQDYFDECGKTPGRAPPSVSEFLPWSMSAERKLSAALPAGYSRPG
jgi:transposase